MYIDIVPTERFYLNKIYFSEYLISKMWEILCSMKKFVNSSKHNLYKLKINIKLKASYYFVTYLRVLFVSIDFYNFFHIYLYYMYNIAWNRCLEFNEYILYL